ncbi:MAG TPA: ABC transporter ATP-binding protein [Bacillota bacterium]|nr:ABC transporter ATP-binding protein [Bacillota bacterium]HQC35895.1 ABC transporter ATP-binding protein [Bacillota bacterium]
MIQVSSLVKKFGSFTALNGLDLCVETGSIYGLVGVNGSGKTTLIKQLTGVLRPDSGEIKFDGEEVYDNISVKKRTAYIPDELYFLGNYNLKSMGEFYRGLYENWNAERFNTMAADFGLSKTDRICRFSKGMQKQAAFILAMSTMPDYLILDEPIDGLDPIMRKKLWGYILGDVAEKQLTVLVSSHNLRELEGICDSIGILSNGRIRFQGKLDELRQDLQDMSLEELFIHAMEGKEDA